MTKAEAVKISQDTFKGDFDETQFTTFISNLYKHYEPLSANVAGGQLKEAFKPFVSHYKRIGKYTDAEGNVIDTIIVHLKKGSSLERARTAQRNFVAEYLKSREKDAALVAFLSPDSSDWRLSLVKFETSFHHDEEKGKLKMVSESTPAKRWSFLIGENEGKHTVTSRFLDLLQSDVSPNLAELEAAFDVETVSKEFFEKYKELFFKMKEALDAIIEGDESIKHDFEAKEISTANFAEKTMGQLSFLYFLQKKGWFGVKPNEAWGTGSKGFLKELFKNRNKYPVHHELGMNFFDDILEPLFYSALAQDRGEAAIYDRLNCRMPFLNGGLFEPMHDYSWETTHVRLPDDLFSNENETKDGDIGDGILDVFDRYNFTVNESEPLEKEVAVDPEMLGKVFERIVASKQNDKFYTPRPIVHYMSQQCLIQYLSDNFKDQSEVSHSDFEFLILNGSRIIENDQIFFEKQQQIKRGEIKSTDYKLLMPEALSALAEEVDTALANIKVCDPAVGSGAFPLGMLNEIVQARAALAVHKKVPIDYYELKKHTILHSIYGVDLDGGAVEIAKLRLWLSLVVEEDEPHPLPNLEFKIAQGNSLLSKYEGITLFDETILETSEHLKQRLSGIKEKINDVQSQINAIELSDGHSSQRSIEDKLSLEHLKRQLANLKGQKTKLEPKKKAASQTDLFEAEDASKLAREKANALQEAVKAFALENQRSKKQKLKIQIKTLKWDLIEATLNARGEQSQLGQIAKYRSSHEQPFFLWKLEFSEVFQAKGGFDVVIGNPPYIQLQNKEKIPANLQKSYQLEDFETFEKTGDIYALFYEMGLNLSNPETGLLSLITSNSWMCTKYGASLREIFSWYQGIELIDFSGNHVFDNATVDTNIFTLKNSSYQSPYIACNVKEPCPETDFLREYLKIHSGSFRPIKDNSWFIGSAVQMALKEKIECLGTPLNKLNAKINFGIKTGFNDAFIIDQNKRDELVRNDPKSADIIKPTIRGRNIQRYSSRWNGEYLIATFPALNLDIDDYPAVKSYLESYGRKLYQTGEVIGYNDNGKPIKSRKATSNKWFETQDQIAYHRDFEKEKLSWIELADEGRFSIVSEGMYCEATTFIMTCEHPKAMTALLNSKLINWYFDKICAESGVGTNRWKKVYVEKIPIVQLNSNSVSGLASKVDEILSLAACEDHDPASPSEKQLSLEAEIDELVFDLYELTDEERQLVRDTVA